MLFRSDLADRIAGHRYALHMVMTEGAEGVFVPSGTTGRWLYDREWHPDNGESLEDWPEDRCVDVIRQAAGMPDLDVELIGVFPWSFGAAVADVGPRRRRLPRRGRRTPHHTAWRHRHEHRHRGRTQPRLEAGLGGSWMGRNFSPRQLPGRALPGRAAQRSRLPRRSRGHTPPRTSNRTSASSTPPTSSHPRAPPSGSPTHQRRKVYRGRFQARVRRTPGSSTTGAGSPRWTSSTVS